MPALDRFMVSRSRLSKNDVGWLGQLVEDWQILADMSFSDLILWIPDEDPNIFWAAAQIRPDTGPTALEEDVVGESVSYDDENLVTEAFMSAEMCETSNNKLSAGIPVDVWAIPVIRHDEVIAVVERHTNQMGVRAPGSTEDNYLEIAGIISEMLHHGSFPIFPNHDRALAPRVTDGVIRVATTGMVTYASPNGLSAFRKLGLSGDLDGEYLIPVVRELCPNLRDVGQTVGMDLDGKSLRETDIENAEATLRARVIPLRTWLDDFEVPAGTLILVRDLTELRSRDRQLVTKDATIREIHHRVKNNLQTVAALLRLQSRRMTSEDARLALKQAMGRVSAIAVVHEILSQNFEEEVDFDEVADRILKMVGDVAASSGRVIARREGSFGKVHADAATALSLATTELCQNAIEHSLGSSSGEVVVRPHKENGFLVVDIVNNGKPLPEGFSLSDHRTSLGLSIVTTLVEDLGGTFTLENNPDNRGTCARISVARQD
ncbi:sensor histidine kinase [Acidipropionibacterium virtanenii]|uniref:histidine kinase n=1 Tax=Acidipropionibacterium virtanenii TaxID=2057246 RepID=A0A344UTR7_9ACTN|nr:sensor histidine kinase [Acidipropionibacterium virtanenii]AXE38665.1 putative sensor histidine kinase pdtaS [Acidipropionibacterium virtanenii]